MEESDKMPRWMPETAEAGNRAFVKGSEDLAAKPTALKGDDTTCKVPSGAKDGKTSFDAGAVDRDVRRVCKRGNCGCDFVAIEAVNAVQNPGKLTKSGERHSDQLCTAQQPHGCIRLSAVVADRGPHKDVGISGNLHFCPDQPFAAA
jgi:hypothetical protein